MGEEFEGLRIASGLHRRQFAERIDNRLRGHDARLPRRDRCLRALVAKYGWASTCAAAIEVVKGIAR